MRASDGATIWQHPLGQLRVPSPPLVINDVIYVVDNSDIAGEIDALRASDGSLLWTAKPLVPTGQYSEPVVGEDILYLTGRTGTEEYVYALQPADGATLWRTKVHASYLPPTLEGSDVYVGSASDSLSALRDRDGALSWQITLDSLPFLTADSGVVYASTFGGQLYALDARSGTQRWCYQTETLLEAAPSVSNGIVYASLGAPNVEVVPGEGTAVLAPGGLLALRGSDGMPLWHLPFDIGVAATPTLLNGAVFTGSADANVYAVRAADGTRLWTFATSGGIGAALTVVG